MFSLPIEMSLAESNHFRNTHDIIIMTPCQMCVCVCVCVCAGLTGVDVVKQLYAGGHAGRVVMASRQGRLPTVKAAVNDPFLPLTIATPEGERQLERDETEKERNNCITRSCMFLFMMCMHCVVMT
jgi:hypothetical protein